MILGLLQTAPPAESEQVPQEYENIQMTLLISTARVTDGVLWSRSKVELEVWQGFGGKACRHERGGSGDGMWGASNYYAELRK